MEGTSTIGRGTVVRGSVRGDGDLEVLGRVEGSVAVEGDLSIGESALVQSDVSGRRVTVQGAVAGNVSATLAIVLEPGARVVGDLGAPQIGIRPGALVRGMVSTHGSLGAAASPAAATRAAAPRPAARPAAPRPVEAARPRPAPARAPAAPARREEAIARAPAPHAPSAPPRAAEEEEPHAPLEAHREPHHSPEPEEEVAEHAGGTHSPGPPPPIVPQLRKGAKASLKRKGGR